MSAHDPEEILRFWFSERGDITPETARRFLMKNHEFEREVSRLFADTHAAVSGGACEEWLESPRGRLAYVIVLDQISRNLFHGTPRMFAHDPQALRAALDGIDRGHHRALAPEERSALYMPLMHAEDPAVQERSVALFEELRAAHDASDEVAAYAATHRDIVRRFGRFPHRNAILNRASTPDELEFLNEPDTAF